MSSETQYGVKFILGSLVAIASIPLIALALEPSDPVGFCGRFVDEKDVNVCQTRTMQENVDWYAASICNLQKDDGAFWKCWEAAKDKAVNPQALEKCDDNPDMSDEQRQACMDGALGVRKPASEAGIFQPLKKKK